MPTRMTNILCQVSLQSLFYVERYQVTQNMPQQLTDDRQTARQSMDQLLIQKHDSCRLLLAAEA